MAYKLTRETEMTVADMWLVLCAAAAAALEIKKEERNERKRSEKRIASKKKKKVKDWLKRRVQLSSFFCIFSCLEKLDVLDDVDVPSDPFYDPAAS